MNFMDYRFFLSGIRAFLFDPAGAWEKTGVAKKPVKFIRDSFLLPLILLVSLASFAGSLLFTNTELSPLYSIFTGVRTFLVLYLAIHVSAVIFREVTFPLDLGRDFHKSFIIITFSFVPFLICQIFSSLFESLLFVNIIGLYGLYIFWEGAEKFLDPPQYKKMPLLIATAITMAVVYISADKLFKMLFDKIFYAFFD